MKHSVLLHGRVFLYFAYTRHKEGIYHTGNTSGNMEQNKKKHASNQQNVPKKFANRTLLEQVLGSLDKEIVEKIIPPEHVVKMRES